MAVSLPKQHKVRFYASPDLKQWHQLSDFGPAGDVAGDWECPDLLRIPPVAGKGKGMWALKVGLNPGAPQGGSGEQYFLGSFDGKSFTQSEAAGAHGWTNYGKDDYCAISFNGLPPAEEPILTGWMSNWQYAAKLPTEPWRGEMSLPRRLSLLEDSAGLALVQQPILAPLNAKSKPISAALAAGQPPVTIATMHAPFELNLRFSPAAKGTFGLRLHSDATHWTEIGFDRDKGEFYIDRTMSGWVVPPISPRERPLRWLPHDHSI